LEHSHVAISEGGLVIELVAETFAEMGIVGFKPWRDLVFVRTKPMPQKTGSIYLPNKLASFYGELPNMQLVTAIVVAVGPKTTLLVGDHIVFLRLNFAYWRRMEDGTYFGWIQEPNVYGWVELDPGDTYADLRIHSIPPNRRLP
jgi:hypothetical protein